MSYIFIFILIILAITLLITQLSKEKMNDEKMNLYTNDYVSGEIYATICDVSIYKRNYENQFKTLKN